MSSAESYSSGGGGAAPDPRPAREASDSRRRRSQLTVMVGLFVTFGGLFGYALQVPTQPAALTNLVPWLAVGFIVAWAGGILAGNTLVAPPPGVAPALRGQPGVAFIATLAGALSAVVVVLRVGPWASPSPGAPVELVIAVTGSVLVWMGGFLMGSSMRRFVRRRRRTRSSGG
ncbi:MAG: hypothetical protein WA688_03890 [Thermoplasmata archaeon]